MTTISLQTTEAVLGLARHLQQAPRVVLATQRRGRGSDDEAMQIATALGDIQESANELFADLVPRLLKADPNSQDAADLLQDIGDAYRHMLYHILDTKMFDYIVGMVE
jgi:hypothetical protein